MSIRTSLRVSLAARRPRAAAEYLPAVLDIQDLFSLVYRGWVPARAGPATLASYDGSPPLFWNRMAMHRSPRAIVLPDRPRATYGPSTWAALMEYARRTHICAEFGAVVSAVTSPYREGPESIEASVQRLRAAIERYVGMHRRTTTWASMDRLTSEVCAVALLPSSLTPRRRCVDAAMVGRCRRNRRASRRPSHLGWARTRSRRGSSADRAYERRIDCAEGAVDAARCRRKPSDAVHPSCSAELTCRHQPDNTEHGCRARRGRVGSR